MRNLIDQRRNRTVDDRSAELFTFHGGVPEHTFPLTIKRLNKCAVSGVKSSLQGNSRFSVEKPISLHRKVVRSGGFWPHSALLCSLHFCPVARVACHSRGLATARTSSSHCPVIARASCSNNALSGRRHVSHQSSAALGFLMCNGRAAHTVMTSHYHGECGREP